MTERADASTAAARRASVTEPRPPARALAPADRVAWRVGAVFAILMLAWLAWQLARTVVQDRAVGSASPARAAHGH